MSENLYAKCLQELEKGFFPEIALSLHKTQKTPKAKTRLDPSALLPLEELDHVDALFLCNPQSTLSFYHYLPWLEKKEERCLCLIYENQEDLEQLLHDPGTVKLLSHSQSIICFHQEMQGLEAQIEVLCSCLWQSTCLIHKEVTSSFNVWEKISHRMAYQKRISQEMYSGGQRFYKNFYKNTLVLDKAYQAHALFRSLPKVPAIICGSGPSLEKTLFHLSKAEIASLKNRSLWIAAGSACTTLTKHGIQAHLFTAFGADPSQERLLRENLAFEIPFIYQNRLTYSLLQQVHGPRFCLHFPESYTISFWLENILKLPEIEETPAGVSISNFSASLALRFSASPLAFLGVDLSYSGNKRYASKLICETKQALRSHAPWSEELACLNQKGAPSSSNLQWFHERDVFTQLTQEHSSCPMFNCSQEGLEIPGMQHLSFEKYSKKYLQKSYNIEAVLHTHGIQNPMPVRKKQIQKSLKSLYSSMKRSAKLLLEIESSLLQESSEQTKAQSMLSQEQAYEYVLAQLEDFFIYSQSIRIYQIQMTSSLSEKQKYMQLLDLKRQSLSFSYRCACQQMFWIKDSLQSLN